jgi:phosphoglycolate phosphatase-like HAD superfamily hydrolase/ADP-ribose pyrophosphatase YjhB (NUDIX family)
MKSFRSYIFDLDDTLLNTFQGVTRLHYPLLAQRLGLRYRGEEAVRKMWGASLADCLPQIFQGSFTPERALAELASIHEEHPLAPVEGAQEILRVLRRHDKLLSIVSAGSPPIVNTSIRCGLALDPQSLDCVYSTVLQRTAKPSPKILKAIIAKHRRVRGDPPAREEILYLGDALSDYLTAKNSGIAFAAVTTGVHTREDFLAAGLAKDWIFPSLKEAIVPPESHGVVSLIQNDAGEYLLVKEARQDNPYCGSWSGPHGRCVPEDILEEETVTRETLEECGIEVRPLRKVYERAADTRVDTVAFWETCAISDPSRAYIAHAKEVAAIRWASLREIRAGGLPLYPGTRDYFFNHADCADGSRRQEARHE